MGLRGVKSRLDVDDLLFPVLVGASILFSLGNGQLEDVESAHALGDDLLPVVQVVRRNLKVVVAFIVLRSAGGLVLVFYKQVFQFASTFVLVFDELGFEF